MIFKNVANYTSDVQSTEYGTITKFIGIDGPAAVYLETKAQGDDTFRRYPQASFNGPFAGVITIPGGQWRIVTVGAATTVIVL